MPTTSAEPCLHRTLEVRSRHLETLPKGVELWLSHCTSLRRSSRCSSRIYSLASFIENQWPRSTSGVSRRRPERGGHSICMYYSSIRPDRNHPAHAVTSLPLFCLIEPRSSKLPVAGKPVSSSPRYIHNSDELMFFARWSGRRIPPVLSSAERFGLVASCTDHTQKHRKLQKYISPTVSFNTKEVSLFAPQP
jgi:hypothetical protein